MKRKSTILLMAGIIFLAFASESIASDPFVKPEIIENNVEFWKQIYSQVPRSEGVYHDQEYPLIIYGRHTIGERQGTSRKAFIRSNKEPYLKSLKRILSVPKARWSDNDKRIAALFAKYAPGNTAVIKSAADRIRFQQGQKELFKSGLERSSMYLDTIRSILDKYGVPRKLAYLPHVESSFRPDVYSKAGAAGMWQFMAGTGRRFLAINDYVDERLDPIFSTAAAAQLLAYNYKHLKSWPLAITAYNHGLNGMKRAVSKLGTRDLKTILTKHESRRFKFASKNFYACFIAACEIAEEPEKYFDSLEYHPPRLFHELVLTHWIQPHIIARQLDLDKREFLALNPAVRTDVYASKAYLPKGSRIRIPESLSIGEAGYALSQIPDSLKSAVAPQVRYRVRKGDTLSRIASRYGVSTSRIARLNKLSRPDRIYVGQVLRIPQKTP